MSYEIEYIVESIVIALCSPKMAATWAWGYSENVYCEKLRFENSTLCWSACGKRDGVGHMWILTAGSRRRIRTIRNQEEGAVLL